jgi:RNA polymerase sigma-70 factor (ECF subfamily)
VGGDAEAFGDLYVRYLDDIYRYVFYRVRDEKGAEDLTERVFVSAWEAIGKYEPRGYPFSSWLYRIAHNAVVDYYRTRRDEKPLDAIAFTLADESLGPEETLIKKRDVSRLLEAVAQLSEEKQRLIILRFVDGMSHAHVAQILGKSEGACRVIQHRALAALSETLGKE